MIRQEEQDRNISSRGSEDMTKPRATTDAMVLPV
jgi:hypothetical protein